VRIREYFRRLPHIWCPGCGNGTIINAMLHAIDELGLKKEEIVAVSGIGCFGRATGYLDFYTLHTTHGRAPAFATGIKLIKPEMKVFVLMGDGDAAAIGGNHLIHAARRDIDLIAIVANNSIYGMTGGQASPTTPEMAKTTTTPAGCKERPFDLCELVMAAGASYVARWTTYHVRQLKSSIKEAIEHPGFSFIEVLSQCPTQFGRRNKMDHIQMLRKFKEETSLRGEEGKIKIGVFRR